MPPTIEKRFEISEIKTMITAEMSVFMANCIYTPNLFSYPGGKYWLCQAFLFC